ncbi:MAG: hypothetical protein ACT4O5_17330 [Gammaproteobacteria bacterium]
MLRILRPVLAISLSALLMSCPRSCPPLPELRESDAGDYSWVRQVVPKITGRKAHGYAEVKVLADLVAASDRPMVLRAIFLQADRRQEYIDHWSENFVEFLRIHRETAKAQTNDCFGPGVRSPADYTLALAQFVRDNDPLTTATVPGGNFNMTDLLRSSLALDDLSPVYRAYLFAMVNRPISGAETTERNRRDDLGAAFTRVYAHRQLLCLTCHTTTASTTGPQTFWNRHFPIRGRFSESLFGAGTGRPSDEVHALLRTDVVGGASRPWGLQSCGAFRGPTGVPVDPLTSPGGTTIQSYFVRAQGNRSSAWTLESEFRAGYQALTSSGLVRDLPTGASAIQCNYCNGNCPQGSGTSVPPDDPAAVARETAAQTALQSNGCFSCHNGGSGNLTMNVSVWQQNTVARISNANPSLLLVSPGDAAASYLMRKLDSPTPQLPDGSNRMPPGGQMSATDRNAIRAWINGLALVAGCPACAASGSPACATDYVGGSAAFAYLSAGRVVENTWQDVLGAPLTIANYFARNSAQRDILWNLTEAQFIPGRWSMQWLLSRMMTSDFFNRASPELSTGPSAHELPMYLDPWVAADPRLPPVALPGTPPGSGTAPTADPAYDRDDETNRPREYNTMGDGVHRYSPRSLLYSVHSALGWPTPKREASGVYPDNDLRKAIGEFYRDAEPGFREIGFQSLLSWEVAHGVCAKPANQTPVDWIDRLVAEVDNYNTTHASDAKLRDVVIAVKDRILADPSLLSPTPTGAPGNESALLQALFGAALNTDADASAANAAALEDQIRAYCGVLLETPQFMLAGIAPTKLGEKPKLLVCLPGEPCGYQPVCQSFTSALSQLGYTLTCSADSLAIAPKPPFTPPRMEEFCPRGRCGRVPFRVPELDKCLLQPDLCLHRKPPPCDPRCQRIDCCGGPLPPIDGEELFLFWADQAKVRIAEDVRILRAGKSKFDTLAKGDVLKTGEVLVIPADGRLRIDAPDGKFATPEKGLGPRGERKFWLVQVTGPQALIRNNVQDLQRLAIDAALRHANEAYWLRSGEAGSPTIPGQPKEPSDLPGRSKRPPATPMTKAFDIGPKQEPKKSREVQR